MRYPIVIYPNKILTKPAKKVNEITDELIVMLDAMYETMTAHDGIGLAAPQVGKNVRVAIVQLEVEDELLELINPEIIFREGTTIDVEACLSIPNRFGTIKRSKSIVVRYFDREGEEYEVSANNYFARIIQHELDHLDGKLFINQIIEEIAPEDLEEYMEENQHD